LTLLCLLTALSRWFERAFQTLLPLLLLKNPPTMVEHQNKIKIYKHTHTHTSGTHTNAQILTPWSTVLLQKLTSHSASQKIFPLLWNSKVHYHIHNSLPLDPFLSQLNTLQTFTYRLRSILILSSPIDA
jgi:hypothetical protein